MEIYCKTQNNPFQTFAFTYVQMGLSWMHKDLHPVLSKLFQNDEFRHIFCRHAGFGLVIQAHEYIVREILTLFSCSRVIKPPDFSNVSLLGFGEIFALLFDNRYLYIMDLRTEKLISRWPLPEYRKSKRGSSFLAGEISWLNGLNGQNDTGLVFATSMPDHSIHLVLWKEHGWKVHTYRIFWNIWPISSVSIKRDFAWTKVAHPMVSSCNAQSFTFISAFGNGLFWT